MILLAVSAVTLLLQGQSLPDSFFEEKVRPVLAANCYSCHTNAKTSGLRLDSRESLLQGGSLGPALVPGNAERSLLLQAVTHTHPKLRMPPGGKLAQKEIDALSQWIAAGAPWPHNVTVQKPALWAAQPIRSVAGPIDHLWKSNAAPAEKSALIRRLHFDLTGLPPTWQGVRNFVDDASPTAYEKLVDTLLASPHFGERWARHWLDVARYAEEDVRGIGQAGYPNAWRYRDWVIGAFQQDLPYDEFVRLQIAADVAPRPGHDDRAALGLFGLGPWYYSNAPPPESRADERHDRVDVLTRGFLGLTVACARCHDHKFDPISTADYYALAGVFARTQYAEYPLADVATVAGWDQHKQRLDDVEKTIQDFLAEQSRQLASILVRDTARFLMTADGVEPKTLQRWKQYLAKKQQDHPFLNAWRKDPSEMNARAFQELVLDIVREKKEIDEENAALLAPSRPKRNAAKTRLPNGFSTYDEFCPGCSVAVRSLQRDRYVLWSDLFRVAEKNGGILHYPQGEIETFLEGPWKAHLIQLRAERDELKKSLPPQYPYIHAIAERSDAPEFRIHIKGDPYNLGNPAPRRFLQSLGAQSLDQGSGRAQLAAIVSRHPLTVRVAVNRIWGLLFGEYIVASPSNFGALGQKPSNAELLEYLAHRFTANQYSVKKLIKEIVLSNAYKESGRRRRLDAESVRDAMLSATSLLHPDIGGPSVDLAKDRSRRAIYGKISRFRLDDSLALFDFPSPAITSEKRNVTHVPQQQLFLLNSPFVADAAAAAAKKVAGAASLYRLLLARDPAKGELERAQHFLKTGDLVLKTGDLAELAQVLLSSNEFLFVD